MDTVALLIDNERMQKICYLAAKSVEGRFIPNMTNQDKLLINQLVEYWFLSKSSEHGFSGTYIGSYRGS